MGLEEQIKFSFIAENEASKQISVINKSLESLVQKTKQATRSAMSMTDVLNKSLIKRKDFNFNKQLGFDVMAEGAAGAKKEITGITDVLQQSLGKRKDFDFNKQLGLDVAAEGAKTFGKEMKGANKSVSTFEEKLKKAQKASLSIGLSMLFTGMAIKRFADNAIKSITKTFMDVTDGSNFLNQKITQLRASFEFLKFSILETLGQSESFIGFLKFLIEANRFLGQFVGKHPLLAKVLAVFVLLGSVVGGFMMVLGQSILAVTGIISALQFFGVTGAMVTAAVTAGLATIAAILTVLGIAFGIIVALWVTDLGGFREFIKKTFGTIWLIIKEVFKDIGELLSALIDGDWARAWEKAKEIVLEIFLGIGVLIVNAIGWAYNSVLDIIIKMSKVGMSIVKPLAKLMDKLFNTNTFTSNIAMQEQLLNNLKRTVDFEYIGTGEIKSALQSKGFMDQDKPKESTAASTDNEGQSVPTQNTFNFNFETVPDQKTKEELKNTMNELFLELGTPITG